MPSLTDKVRRFLRRGDQAGSAAEEETPPAHLSEEALRDAIKRTCQPLSVGGFLPLNDPLASVFGAARVQSPDENWPQGKSGPLTPICQLNLTQAHVVPQNLSDLAMIQIFVDLEALQSHHELTWDEDEPAKTAQFVVRSYRALDGLIPVNPQATLANPFEARWDVPVPDYAGRAVAGEVVDTTAYDVHSYHWAVQVHRTKLGGWPAVLRAEPWWKYRDPLGVFDYALQIAPENQAGWNGPWCFIGRGISSPNLWALDMQND